MSIYIWFISYHKSEKESNKPSEENKSTNIIHISETLSTNCHKKAIFMLLFSSGKPVFLGRHDDRTRLNVGQTYQDVIRIKGERDVTVLFQEQDFTDTSKWHDLKTLTLGESDAGFTLSFTVQRRHYAGIHHFKYTAENAKGGAILTRTLQINQVRLLILFQFILNVYTFTLDNKIMNVCFMLLVSYFTSSSFVYKYINKIN